jgi:hypothetical protein
MSDPSDSSLRSHFINRPETPRAGAALRRFEHMIKFGDSEYRGYVDETDQGRGIFSERKSGWRYTGEFLESKAHGLGVKEWGRFTSHVMRADGPDFEVDGEHDCTIACEWVDGEYNGYAVRRWTKGIIWYVHYNRGITLQSIKQSESGTRLFGVDAYDETIREHSGLLNAALAVEVRPHSAGPLTMERAVSSHAHSNDSAGTTAAVPVHMWAR